MTEESISRGQILLEQIKEAKNVLNHFKNFRTKEYNDIPITDYIVGITHRLKKETCKEMAKIIVGITYQDLSKLENEFKDL